MIKHLYIKNFILIDELDLDFESGFSVFTGETGAGKSILINAISMLCADRSSASLVKQGKDKAIIEGTFEFPDESHAVAVLKEAGFEVEEQTTFTREISASGKSTVRIDHRMASLSLLKDCLGDSIDIHGQRDNAYLLNNAVHINLLDQYLSLQKERDETARLFDIYSALVKEKEDALSETYNESDLDYFQSQVEEIEAASLREGEEEQLREKEKQYKQIKDSYEKVSQIFNIYDSSLSDNLYELHHLFSTLPETDDTLPLANTVSNAYYDLSDAMASLHDIYDDNTVSEEEINEIQERLFTLQRLKRKYGRTIGDILATADELRDKISQITHRQEYLEKKNKEIQKAFDSFNKAAVSLSEKRRNGAGELDEKIRSNLKDLMLENARFMTQIDNAKPSRNGIDKVEFMISMNPGEPLRPLAKTASGGELSRVMLGLKDIFAKLQGTETIIFDEIDTGVSGPVATAIGKKMRSLSRNTQVFSVTHLAQVASCAKHHYFVSKSTDGEKTITSVRLLNPQERIEQIALISSGEVTAASKKAARELLKRNHN